MLEAWKTFINENKTNRLDHLGALDRDLEGVLHQSGFRDSNFEPILARGPAVRAKTKLAIDDPAIKKPSIVSES